MILTVDELRSYIATSLSDDAVLGLLDAAEHDLGSMEAVTERKVGGYAALVLDRRVGTITTVKEDIETSSPLTLAANDYRVDGYLRHRLDTGTNPGTTWSGEVEVIHTPVDDLAERKRAQVALVRLDLTIQGGITSERIGDYAVGYGGSTADYESKRASIIAPFRPAMVR
jgi:hypothetical protein